MKIRAFQAECELVHELNVHTLDRDAHHRLALQLVHDGIGRAVYVPILVARGRHDGPTFGVTAAVHGNELNGIPVVQRLLASLDTKNLKGTVVGVPVVNVPAYLGQDRTLREGMDLNRLMPGKAEGNRGELYAFRFLTRVVERFDYLIDLHTASFGRLNSLYVRANLQDPVTAKMAELQSPQIIVHKAAEDGTLRGAAMRAGIPAITVEMGSSQSFEQDLVEASVRGLLNLLSHFEMIPQQELPPTHQPILCSRSYWLYTQHGGLLEVKRQVAEHLAKGQEIAVVRNIFGDPIGRYDAPEDTVVIAVSNNPVCESGSRIIHLGVKGRITDSACDTDL